MQLQFMLLHSPPFSYLIHTLPLVTSVLSSHEKFETLTDFVDPWYLGGVRGVTTVFSQNP